MKIILIRHGHVEGIAPERFRGRADLPLTSLGRKQADLTALRVAKYRPVAIYSSPLRRAVETAEPLALACSLPIQRASAFSDIDYGNWQGLTPDEVRARWPAELELWYTAPQLVSISGGESLADVFARMTGGLYPLLEKHESETIAIVAHDTINRVLLLHALELPQRAYWKIAQEPCAINNIDHDRQRHFAVRSMNDTCHLEAIP